MLIEIERMLHQAIKRIDELLEENTRLKTEKRKLEDLIVELRGNQITSNTMMFND